MSRSSALKLLGGLSNVGLDEMPAPGRTVNIELYQLRGRTDRRGVQEEFGVRVTYAPGGGGVQQKLLTAIAGGNPPDAAMIVPSRTPQWAEFGIMGDLTADFRAPGSKESDFFAPAVTPRPRPGGRRVAVDRRLRRGRRGGWCLFVPTAARYPDAAFEFLRWRPFQDVLVTAKHNTFLP